MVCGRLVFVFLGEGGTTLNKMNTIYFVWEGRLSSLIKTLQDVCRFSDVCRPCRPQYLVFLWHAISYYLVLTTSRLCRRISQDLLTKCCTCELAGSGLVGSNIRIHGYVYSYSIRVYIYIKSYIYIYRHTLKSYIIYIYTQTLAFKDQQKNG